MNEDAAAIFSQAAKEALHHFGITAETLELIKVSENVTYRVHERTTKNQLALRLHRPGYQSLKSLKSEVSWTQALASSGIKVPNALRTISGETLAKVVVKPLGQKRWASATEWIDGCLLSQLFSRSSHAEKLAYFAQIGRLLAAMHNQSSNWRIPKGFVRRKLDADGLMGERPIWGAFWKHRLLSAAEQDLLLQARMVVHDRLMGYGQEDRTFGLIHADLHFDNVLVHKQALVPIDFDDAAFGWYVFDIAAPLTRYCIDPSCDAYVHACIDGYLTSRELSEQDSEMLYFFMLVRAMLVLGWFHERPEVEEEASLVEIKEWVRRNAADLISSRPLKRSGSRF